MRVQKAISAKIALLQDVRIWLSVWLLNVLAVILTPILGGLCIISDDLPGLPICLGTRNKATRQCYLFPSFFLLSLCVESTYHIVNIPLVIL